MIGLIILAVMTILGLAGMRNAGLEELMARQTKDQNSAFQAAEAGVQAALNYLADSSRPPTVNAQGSEHVWPACEVSDPDPTAACSLGTFHPCCFLQSVIANWEAYDPKVTGSALTGKALSDLGGEELAQIPTQSQPHVVIVDAYSPNDLDYNCLASRGGLHYFTIAAIGLDPGTSSRAIVQTTVTKTYACQN